MREPEASEVTEVPKVKVTDKRHSREDPPEGSTAPAAAPEADAEADAEVEAPREGDPSTKAAEYLEHLQRLQAEFDNYRKRVLKEQTRAVEFASEPLMGKLLEVLDEFELALLGAERTPELERFLQGFEMVYAKLQEILRSEGLERIDAKSQPFDPELHEALMQADHDSEGEQYVADVLRAGYRLRGRVIRAAGVKVGRR